jgi:hypothetical protein
MEEVSPYLEVENKTTAMSCGPMIGGERGGVLLLVLHCHVRAAADREARPGLK